LDIAVILQLVLVGVVAGLLAGIFGVGGGLVVVPMLIILLPQDLLSDRWLTHCAVATSLSSIVFTGSISAWRHYMRGGVDMSLARGLSAGVIVGAPLGALFSHWIPAQQLQFAIIAYELIIAYRLLRPRQGEVEGKSLRQVSAVNLGAIGMAIGVISSWLGIGGGSMSVPYLRYLGLQMRQAVATSALIGVPIALAASVAFMAMSPGDVTMPAYSLGFVYLPALLFIVLGSVFGAPLGVSIAHRLPQVMLQRMFALMLVLFAGILGYKAML